MNVADPWHGLAATTVVVTGAARGLGLELTETFLERGCAVVGADLDETALLAAADDLVGQGEFYPVPADVASVRGVVDIEAAATNTGRPVSTWINNAGIVARVPPEDITAEFWDRVMAVNVRSVLLGSQAAHRLMRCSGRGSVINMSSIMGTRTYELRAAYGTSKAAVAHLTRQLADSWGPDGIRVNAIAPGFIATTMSSWVTEDPAAAERVLNDVPLRRFGTPADIARLALFLASELSDYVTGQVIHADGGWST